MSGKSAADRGRLSFAGFTVSAPNVDLAAFRGSAGWYGLRRRKLNWPRTFFSGRLAMKMDWAGAVDWFAYTFLGGGGSVAHTRQRW